MTVKTRPRVVPVMAATLACPAQPDETRNAASGTELSLTATYPPDTTWRVSRDGEFVGYIEASGPLSALVGIGMHAERLRLDHNGEWEVERVVV